MLSEQQIYRIDHYLGKETVQNILMFRFGNGMFEPIWNRRYIDHIQITAAESVGVEQRGGYYEQAGALQENFTREMWAGVFAGETTDQIVRRVRETKAANFKDGVMETSRRGAEAVVRTSAQSILNDARMSVYQANSDVIKGVQAQVTFDNRTSEICMARSGAAWDLDGNPLPGSNTKEDFPGPPPWHPNCRTTLIPIVKSVGEIVNDPTVDDTIKAKTEDLPKRTQASMDGQVAAELTYEDWLRTKARPFRKR